MEQWVNSYREKGWVVLPDFFTEEEINYIYQDAFAIAHIAKNITGWPGMACASYFSEKLFKFYTSKKFYDLTRQIIGDEVYLFSDELIFNKKTEKSAFNVHYDNWFYQQNRDNSIHFTNCYVFLDSIADEDEGIFVVDLEKLNANPADNLDVHGFSSINVPEDCKINITEKRCDVLLMRGNTWQGSYFNFEKESDIKSTVFYACSFCERPITEKIHYMHVPKGIPNYFYTQKFDSHSGDIC